MIRALQAAALVVVGVLGGVLFMKSTSKAPEPEPVAVVAPLPVPAVEPAPIPSAPPPVATEPGWRKATPKPKVTPKPAATSTTTPGTRQPELLPPASPVASSELPAAEPVPAPVLPRRVVIPAGTLLPVRLVETLASDKVRVGDTFSATLDQDIVADGLVIADRGGRAEGHIVATAESGRVKGLATMQVALTHFWTADGQKIEVNTEGFTKTAEKSTKSDAIKVGAGAAIGAAIGAIAGGGKGAAIGAGAGGAAGTGAVLATRGGAAVLPSETRLSFRLSNAVTVQEKRKRS